MEDLTVIERQLERKLDRKSYKRAIDKQLQKVKDQEIKKEEEQDVVPYARKYGKKMKVSDSLSDVDTEMARLIKIHQDVGYTPNSNTLDFDRMKPYLETKLKYRGGLNRSLKDTFGDIDKELSNEAFSVYSKDGEKPTVLFRGSRVDPKDRATIADWKQNLTATTSGKSSKTTENFTKVEKNLARVQKKYNGFKEFIGYSKGGGFALNFSEKYKVPFTVFNPHVNGGHDLSKVNGKIIRTELDPASVLLGLKKTGAGIEMQNLKSLRGNEDALSSHDLANFSDDTSKRVSNPLLTKLQANIQMRKLYSDFKTLNAGGELQTKNGVRVSDGSRGRGLTTTSFDRGIEMTPVRPTPRTSLARLRRAEQGDTTRPRMTSTALDEDFFKAQPRPLQVPRASQGVPRTGVQDVYRQRGLTTTNFGTEMMPPPDVSGVRPPKLIDTRIPAVDSASKVTSTRQSDFHDKLLSNFVNSTPEIKTATMKNLGNRIVSSTQGIQEDFIAPQSESIRSQLSSGVRGSLMSGGKLVGSGLLGAGVGIGISELTNALHLDGGNPYVNSAITGTLSGGITEGAATLLARGATSALAGGAAGALSGGIGAIVGSYATSGIENLFGPDANVYARDIIGNIAGSEIGTLAGIATVGTAGALASAAGVEAAVAAADWWNPIGWGTAIALGVTGIAAGIAGGIQAGQDAKAKSDADALQIQETKEVNYAGNIDQLSDQYDYLRTYFTEMGMSPTVIGQLNTQLLAKAGDENATPLTQAEFSDLFTDTLNQYSIDGFSYQDSTPSTQQQIQKEVMGNSNVHNSMLASLVTAMNAKGASVVLPPPKMYTAKDFATVYNGILGSNPSVAAQIGIPMLPIPGDIIGPDLTSSIPTTLDATRVQGYEQQINAAQAAGGVPPQGGAIAPTMDGSYDLYTFYGQDLDPPRVMTSAQTADFNAQLSRLSQTPNVSSSQGSYPGSDYVYQGPVGMPAYQTTPTPSVPPSGGAIAPYFDGTDDLYTYYGQNLEPPQTMTYAQTVDFNAQLNRIAPGTPNVPLPPVVPVVAPVVPVVAPVVPVVAPVVPVVPPVVPVVPPVAPVVAPTFTNVTDLQNYYSQFSTFTDAQQADFSAQLTRILTGGIIPPVVPPPTPPVVSPPTPPVVSPPPQGGAIAPTMSGTYDLYVFYGQDLEPPATMTPAQSADFTSQMTRLGGG